MEVQTASSFTRCVLADPATPFAATACGVAPHMAIVPSRHHDHFCMEYGLRAIFHVTQKNYPVTIAFIIPYFGKLPWYFPWFLHSCRANPSVDFFIITDDPGFDSLGPSNVFFVNKSLGDIKQLVKDKLQLPISIDHGYKLCDFRPAFGIIFSEYLVDYDFWGHTDIDVVFGNIRTFITDEVLWEYDVISTRPEYISGFFALYRNCEKMNGLFQQSVDHKKIFSDPLNYGFDECGFLCDQLAEGALIDEVEPIVDSMTHVVNRLEKRGEVKAYFNFHAIEGVPGEMKWQNGQLLFKNEYEVLLYHMISFKVHPRLAIPLWEQIPQSYYINENSFSV